MRIQNIFLPSLLLIGLFTGSCNDNCCSLGVNKICEGDAFCEDYASWEECREYLENNLTYNCN